MFPNSKAVLFLHNTIDAIYVAVSVPVFTTSSFELAACGEMTFLQLLPGVPLVLLGVLALPVVRTWMHVNLE